LKLFPVNVLLDYFTFNSTTVTQEIMITLYYEFTPCFQWGSWNSTTVVQEIVITLYYEFTPCFQWGSWNSTTVMQEIVITLYYEFTTCFQWGSCCSIFSILCSALLISLFLKVTVHSTYTEKSQRNELIKLYTIYTCTVDGLSREDKLSSLYI
jgi:hypothetical protein